VRRDIETDLRDLIELVANAKQMPLSNSALIPRDDVLGLLEQALRSLPDEIREARWALRDREELMRPNCKRPAIDGPGPRRSGPDGRQNRDRSPEPLDGPTDHRRGPRQSRQMINQSEDFIDGKLGSFEIVLERLLKTTHSGRERLSAQGCPRRSSKRPRRRSRRWAPRSTRSRPDSTTPRLLRPGRVLALVASPYLVRSPNCCATCPRAPRSPSKPSSTSPRVPTARAGRDRRLPRGDRRLQLRLESFNGGLRVRGQVEAPWHGVCRRCSTPVLG